MPQARPSIWSDAKWAGLSHSCLGHREEGKIFSPDQLETTEEGKGHPETPSQGHYPPWQVHRQQSAALASKLQERKGRWLPLLSALVPRGLALGFSLVPQKLQHLHGLELALLLTVRLSLSLEICSKEQRHSAREGGSTWVGWGSGQCH